MKQSVFITAFFLVFFFGNEIKAQEPEFPAESRGTHVEFMLIPTGILNVASFGLSYNNIPNIEQVLDADVEFLYPYYIASAAFGYNCNIKFYADKKISTYIPIWASTRVTSYPNPEYRSFERGSEQMRNAIGTGWGIKFLMRNRHKLRIEVGAGAALASQRSHWMGAKPGWFQVDYHTPIVLALRFAVRYVIPLPKRSY